MPAPENSFLDVQVLPGSLELPGHTKLYFFGNSDPIKG